MVLSSRAPNCAGWRGTVRLLNETESQRGIATSASRMLLQMSASLHMLQPPLQAGIQHALVEDTNIQT